MTTLSAAADPTTTQRAADGRFVKAAASPVPPPPPNAPSTTVDYGQQRGPAMVDAPSPTDDYGSEPVKPPSVNGEIQRPPKPSKRVAFDWLADLRPAGGRHAKA